VNSDRFPTIISRCVAVMLLAAATALPLISQEEAQEPVTENPPAADATALMKIVAENQKQIEATQKDYIFHRKDEERVTDKKGAVKSTRVKEYEVYYIGPWSVQRLLSKDGKPLSASEQKKQGEEVRKQERKARERIAKQEAGEDPGKDTITLGKFLAADRFYNLRHDTYQGREVYALDFEPRSDFQPHSLIEKVLKSLGGTLWVDAQAKDVARLEAHFLEGLKVAGGLVGSIQKGGSVIIEQRFVNEEVWMPTYVEIQLAARVFFLHRTLNVVSSFSDYRKFRVDSKIMGVGQELPAPEP
jgi:hypothetical protein